MDIERYFYGIIYILCIFLFDVLLMLNGFRINLVYLKKKLVLCFKYKEFSIRFY